MSFASTELITSRTISYGSGVPVGVREYHVTGAPNESDVWSAIEIGVFLPAKLSSWNTVATGGSVSSVGWIFPTIDLRVFDYEIRRDPNVQAAWFVRVVYRELGEDPVQTNYLPGEIGYVNLRSTFEAQFVDAWRQWDTQSAFLHDLDLTTYAAATGTNPIRTPRFAPGSLGSDIQGNKIDIAGDPTSTIVYKQRIVVDLIAPTRINAQWLRDFMGTRNFATFLGVEPGALLFTGADASIVTPGKWQHTYNFDADYGFHLIQRPARNSQGDIILSLGSGQANIVSWIQPFPRTMSFADIEPSGYLRGL